MDDFGSLERQHVQLEDNIKKLRASLQHWQAWEVEYEHLKEDALISGNNIELVIIS